MFLQIFWIPDSIKMSITNFDLWLSFGVPVPARTNFEVSKKRNRSFSTPSRFPHLVRISHFSFIISIIVLSSIIITIVIVTLCRHHHQHQLHQVMIQTMNHLTMTIKKKSKRQNQQPKCRRTMQRIILIQPWEARIYVFYLEWQLAAILVISRITRTRHSPSRRHTTPK